MQLQGRFQLFCITRLRVWLRKQDRNRLQPGTFCFGLFRLYFVPAGVGRGVLSVFLTIFSTPLYQRMEDHDIPSLGWKFRLEERTRAAQDKLPGISGKEACSFVPASMMISLPRLKCNDDGITKIYRHPWESIKRPSSDLQESVENIAVRFLNFIKSNTEVGAAACGIGKSLSFF